MDGLQLFVQSEGAREIRVVELPATATVRELVELAHADGVARPDHVDGHAAVYVEGRDTPLPLDATLAAAGLGNDSSVHVSRCTTVRVSVHYNGGEVARAFGPGEPMHRVKAWAVGDQGFKLTAVDAAEHVLQLSGTTDRPDDDVHIGALVGATGCTVAFDLVPKVRVEG